MNLMRTYNLLLKLKLYVKFINVDQGVMQVWTADISETHTGHWHDCLRQQGGNTQMQVRSYIQYFNIAVAWSNDIQYSDFITVGYNIGFMYIIDAEDYE